MKKFEHGGNIYGKNIRLDFSVNTNPLGLDPRIKKAVFESADKFGLYPDASCAELKNAIAKYEGVRAENIVCSNGAAEMIFAAARAVMPKRAVLPAPAFSEYERALRAVGCEVKYVLGDTKIFGDTKTAFAESLGGADMTFICNPNNPTGGMISKSEMEKTAAKCAALNIVCIVDECFMDLADGYSAKGCMPVIKAFTKTYSMAGLRLGYMIADGEFAEKVAAQLPAWNVSAPACAAGEAALGCGDYLKKSRGLIREERAYLTAELTKLGLTVFPSAANFLLIKSETDIYGGLLKRGILIRSCANFYGLDGTYYRAAVKTRAENKTLIAALRDILVKE